MSNDPNREDQTLETTNNPAEQSSDAFADQLLDEIHGEQVAASEGGDITDLTHKLMAAEQEILRGHAELENFRKRMQRDTEQQIKFANVPLVRDLLDVIDNLNRAVDAARADETNAKALIDGVQMVSQQFTQALAKHGCKPIEALGTEFDPNFHSAVTQMPSAEYEAGKVALEVAVGYVLHDRVIRPAQVIVSTGNPA
jgi:molecular chaperone GrpE